MMTSPRTLLSAWQLQAKKKFGQNFLTDPSTAEMIVARSKITKTDAVLEVGAGLGALTIPLALAAKKVYAVEKDYRLADILKTQLMSAQINNADIIRKDIFNVDIEELFENEHTQFVVAGNLPYNISSQILIKIVHLRKYFSRAIFMFQKEFAGRLLSGPGSKSYGRITVMLRFCAGLKSLGSVSAGLFFPKPGVDSEVLEINFEKGPGYAVANEAFFFSVIKAAFGQRRKTIKNALGGSGLPLNSKTAAIGLDQAGIDPVRRAETLSVEEFIRLSDTLEGMMTG